MAGSGTASTMPGMTGTSGSAGMAGNGIAKDGNPGIAGSGIARSMPGSCGTDGSGGTFGKGIANEGSPGIAGSSVGKPQRDIAQPPNGTSTLLPGGMGGMVMLAAASAAMTFMSIE